MPHFLLEGITMEFSSQQDAALKDVAYWYKNLRAVKPFYYLAGFAGTGKALPLDSVLKSPNGDINMKDVKIGDVIFGKNGKPIRVTGVFPQGIRPSYRMTFRDGFSVICDESHLWTVATQKNKSLNKWVTKTTKEIIEDGVIRPSGSMRYCIPLCDPVEYSEKEFEIEPYLLGLFIGDGSISSDKIGITVGDVDFKIFEYLNHKFSEDISCYEKSGCKFVYFKSINGFKQIFEMLKLNVKSDEKFIPKEYKFGSKEQRFKLLQGLMDSDGSVKNNRTSYSTTSEKLAYDISELVQSLGGTAIIHKYDRKSKGIEYYINIKMFKNPFRFKHNKNDWEFSEKNPPSRYIKSIEKVEDVEMQCISVDAEDKLYLTDHYVVTHNTTLAKYFTEEINGEVVYCAYTGKAALVMRKNGCLGASTIHSLIYIPEINKKTGEVTYKYNPNSIIATAALIIVDECSMVDSKLGMDLLSYGKPILVLGDPAQLPPVAGAGFFTNGKPDTMLTEIHRQANDNPIIYLASRVRNKETLNLGKYGSSVVTNKFRKDDVFEADQVLCGMNRSRIALNNIFRKEFQFEDVYPMLGETLIGLKNSNKLGIFNGEMFKVEETTSYPTNVHMKLKSQDEEKSVKVKVLRYMFDTSTPEPTDWTKKKGYQELTFGYCLTAHKSQGSQWNNTYVVDESAVFRDDWWRWIYTAITRASEQVTVNI